jgi:hypothetical protein
MGEEMSWFLRARRAYVWDKRTINGYIPVLKEIVYRIIEEHYDSKYLSRLCSPDIGFIFFHDEIALYMSENRVYTLRRRSLLAEFKDIYQRRVGAGKAGEILGNDDAIRKDFPPARAEEIIRRMKLVRNFVTLVNKSSSHNRQISRRVRYLVLRRDKSTCQICGCRAPKVAVHIDHIRPVSWGATWRPSDNPHDYQVLCEDCNIGKSDLS